MTVVGGLHQARGHGLDPGLGVDDQGGGLDRRQHRETAPEEIGIAGGVDQVDVLAAGGEAGDGGVQRVLQLLFHGVEVADRGALGHIAGHIDDAGGREQRLHQGGLSGAGMTDQGDVADVLGIVVRHLGSRRGA